MKAFLEFNLPEEEPEHLAAVKSVDSILLIDDLLNEIRDFLRYGSGEFQEWKDENETLQTAHAATLEKVRAFIFAQREERQIPDLP